MSNLEKRIAETVEALENLRRAMREQELNNSKDKFTSRQDDEIYKFGDDF